ncbi:MAG: TIGR02678 family protein [Mycobacteriales bacterium]
MSQDALERQRAFTGLLRNPVIDKHRHSQLWALVRKPRHRPVLTDWFASRLGYRLVITDSAARLFRLPLHGQVLAPRRHEPLLRRVLVLSVLAAAAAAAEDTEDITTTQDLSDRVRALSRHDDVDVGHYDPDRFAERQLFIRAVGLLVQVGALRQVDRAAEEQREGWAHRRNTVGGAYEVRRELLLRMVDPECLGAALGQRTSSTLAPESEARFGVMRRIIELPVCLTEDLTESQLGYLTGQRHRIVAWCAEMTGWLVEQRAEGMVLIATDESATDLPFPRLRAVDFASLMVLGELVRQAGADDVFTEEDLARAVTEVRMAHPKAMTKDLDSDLAIRDHAVQLLHALDLIRPRADGSWWLSPAAWRYRDPRVVAVTSRLDSIGVDES